MSVESPKPKIYWQVGRDGEKHEIPENATVWFWSEKFGDYLTNSWSSLGKEFEAVQDISDAALVACKKAKK